MYVIWERTKVGKSEKAGEKGKEKKATSSPTRNRRENQSQTK
jgi:hypothetical protein